MKEWKTRKHEEGYEVQYWDEYTYLGNRYIMTELSAEDEMKVGDILMELDIQNLQSVNDILRIKLGMFISAALKNKVFPKLLAILLKRIDKDGVEHDCIPEEFQRGLARMFNPFCKEIAEDFFCLNAELLKPIVDTVGKWAGMLKDIKESLHQVTTSILSATEKSPTTKKSKKSPAAKS